MDARTDHLCVARRSDGEASLLRGRRILVGMPPPSGRRSLGRGAEASEQPPFESIRCPCCPLGKLFARRLPRKLDIILFK